MFNYYKFLFRYHSEYFFLCLCGCYAANDRFMARRQSFGSLSFYLLAIPSDSNIKTRYMNIRRVNGLCLKMLKAGCSRMTAMSGSVVLNVPSLSCTEFFQNIFGLGHVAKYN